MTGGRRGPRMMGGIGGVAASDGGEAALSGANPTIEIGGRCRPEADSVSPMPHPDVALERARLRFAQECLEEMRRRTAARVAADDVLAANEADAEAVKWQLQRRLDSLNDDAGSLCFGR